MVKWLYGVGWASFVLGFIVGVLNVLFPTSIHFTDGFIISLIIGGTILIAVGALIEKFGNNKED